MLLVNGEGVIDLKRINNILKDLNIQIRYSKCLQTHYQNKGVNVNYPGILTYNTYEYPSFSVKRKYITSTIFIPICFELFVIYHIIESSIKGFSCNINIDGNILEIIRRDTMRQHLCIKYKGKQHLLPIGTIISSHSISHLLENLYEFLYRRYDKTRSWMDIIKCFFNQQYMNTIKLHYILNKCGMPETEYRNISIEHEFELSTKIYNFEHLSKESSSYIDKIRQFILNETNYSMRISAIKGQLSLVNNDILESSSVFGEDNLPRLNNITLYGINHIYRYIDNMFENSFATEEEKEKVVSQLGLSRNDNNYIEIINILNNI